MALSVTQLRLLDAPLGAFTVLDLEEANRLLLEWGHNLGACERPFRSEAWVLELEGEPVSLAISASAVSDTVAGYRRGEVVEQARLCSAPGYNWATRIMLRFWRERCAPRWSCWPVKAAIAYHQNAHHKGSIYRLPMAGRRSARTAVAQAAELTPLLGDRGMPTMGARRSGFGGTKPLDFYPETVKLVCSYE
jgi:hypothetical protein